MVGDVGEWLTEHVKHVGEQQFLTAAEVATLADTIYPCYRAVVLVALYGGGVRGRLDVRKTLLDVNHVADIHRVVTGVL